MEPLIPVDLCLNQSETSGQPGMLCVLLFIGSVKPSVQGSTKHSCVTAPVGPGRGARGGGRGGGFREAVCRANLKMPA